MDNKLIGVIMAVVVGVILLGGLLAPIITNYQESEKTVSNTGSYFALVDDEGITHTIIIGAGDDAFTITTDGESAIVPNMATYNLGGFKTISKIANNRFSSWAICDDGTVYGTGYNNYGQQGDGTTTNVTTFTDRTPSGKTAIDVVPTDNTTWILCSDGTIYGAGHNAYGQMGNGTTTDVTTFTDLTPENVTVAKISASRYTTWIISDDGTVYGTGHNNYGQLGDGTTTDVTTFTDLTPSGKTVVDVVATGETTWMLCDDGTVYGTGRDNYGQQGRNIGTGSVTSGFVNRTPSDKTITMISASQETTWMLCSDGTVYGAGHNNYGQMGNGTTTNVITFTDLTPSGKTVTEVVTANNSTWVLCNDGTVYGTGYNNHGQIGDGTTTNVTTFTDRTPSGKTVTEVVATGETTWLLCNDGSLLGCGRNSTGQQGDGTTTDVTTFTDRTPSGKTVTEVVATYQSTMFLCNDETVYSAGYGAGHNNYGQIGDGTTTDVTTFTRIGPADPYGDTASTSLVIGSDAVLRLYTTGRLAIITTTETIELGIVTASDSLTVTVTGDELAYTDKDGNDGTVSDILAYISSTGDMVMCLKPYVVESSEVIIGGYAHNLNTTGGDVISIGYCASGEIGNLEDVTAVLNPVSEGDNTVSSTDLVVNLDDVMTDLKKVDTVLITSTWSDEETSTATYTYFLAPHEITYDNPEYIGENNATILGAIIVMGVVLMLFIVVRLISSRND